MLVHGVCFKSSQIMMPLKLSREFHDHTLRTMYVRGNFPPSCYVSPTQMMIVLENYYLFHKK